MLKVENDIVKDIKPFWNFINNLKKNKSSLPDSFVYNGYSSESKNVSAAFFKDYFSSVYVEDSDDKVLNNFSAIIINSIINVSIRQLYYDEVSDYLSTLNLHAGVGPDIIPPILLNKLMFCFD